MTEVRVSRLFTWNEFEQGGFGGLLELLGDGWSTTTAEEPSSIDIWYDGKRIGNLTAFDPADIEMYLGPTECTHVGPEMYEQSCLSVSFEDEPLPEDANAVNLQEAAGLFCARVAGH